MTQSTVIQGYFPGGRSPVLQAFQPAMCQMGVRVNASLPMAAQGARPMTAVPLRMMGARPAGSAGSNSMTAQAMPGMAPLSSAAQGRNPAGIVQARMMGVRPAGAVGRKSMLVQARMIGPRPNHAMQPFTAPGANSGMTAPPRMMGVRGGQIAGQPPRMAQATPATTQAKSAATMPVRVPPQVSVPRPTPAAQARPVVAPPRVLQLAGGGAAIEVPTNFSLAGTGFGQPLPAPVLQKMESFFGTSFADVRVHVGPQAASIGALAFTQGSNLYFAPGQYNPNTAQGQQVLGHELTHVVQQRTGRVRKPFGAGVAVVQDRALDAEADRMGRQAATHVLQPKVAPGAMPEPSAPGPRSAPTTARRGKANGSRPVQSMVASMPSVRMTNVTRPIQPAGQFSHPKHAVPQQPAIQPSRPIAGFGTVAGMVSGASRFADMVGRAVETAAKAIVRWIGR